MFETPFGVILREARHQAGLSAVKLAQLMGCNKQRISAIETGYRAPSREDVDFFLRALPLDSQLVDYSLNRPGDASRQLMSNARRLLDARPYFPPTQEPAFRRYRAACATFPGLVRPITARLRARPDFFEIFCLTDKMRFDSADEVVSILHLFDLGAIPALHPPNNCAAPPARIVHKDGKASVGHRPHACLIYDSLVIFHQVTFATRQPQTVDLVVWDGTQWRVVEGDGPAHDRRQDEQRRIALGVPVHRYTTAMIEQAALRREPYFADLLGQSRAA